MSACLSLCPGPQLFYQLIESPGKGLASKTSGGSVYKALPRIPALS